MVWGIARQVLGAALVLVLAWFIVRPIMATLTTAAAARHDGPLRRPGRAGFAARPTAWRCR